MKNFRFWILDFGLAAILGALLAGAAIAHDACDESGQPCEKAIVATEASWVTLFPPVTPNALHVVSPKTWKKGDTRPAGDGCNSCTYEGDGAWRCTAVFCFGDAEGWQVEQTLGHEAAIEELQRRVKELEERVEKLQGGKATNFSTIIPDPCFIQNNALEVQWDIDGVN